MNKLEKMKKLSESGTFQGGFATLSDGQLLKLKGGCGNKPTNNCGSGVTCYGSSQTNNCNGATCKPRY